MSQQGTIKRYTLIIEKINKGQFPGFEEIRSFLFEQGFEVSKRTVQRDIEQIRTEFGLEIVYERHRNGYFIDFEESYNTDAFFRFLEIVNTAEMLKTSLSESKESLRYISFDDGGGLRGVSQLEPLLKAVREKRYISFRHQSYFRDKARRYTIKPYLLREYLNRWYVIGLIGPMKEFRTFGIDRITELEVKAKTFEPHAELDAQEAFRNIIGLVYSMGAVQSVILSFTPEQGKYIKSLPLHHSQEVLIDDEKECRIKLEVIPNLELKQQILMQGDRVKVIEPQWLVEEIKEILLKSLERYSSE